MKPLCSRGQHWSRRKIYSCFFERSIWGRNDAKHRWKKRLLKLSRAGDFYTGFCGSHCPYQCPRNGVDGIMTKPAWKKNANVSAMELGMHRQKKNHFHKQLSRIQLINHSRLCCSELTVRQKLEKRVYALWWRFQNKKLHRFF